MAAMKPAKCRAYKLAVKEEREARRAWRLDPTTANLKWMHAAGEAIEQVLYNFERA